MDEDEYEEYLQEHEYYYLMQLDMEDKNNDREERNKREENESLPKIDRNS